MELIVLQGIFLVVIFVVTLISLLVPLWIFPKDPNRQTGWRSPRVLSLCNCFSAGVFLGVCFVGLIPFVRRKFDDIWAQAEVKFLYPITELVVVIGFFLILLIEQLVHQYQERKRGMHETEEMLKHPNEYLLYESPDSYWSDESEYSEEETEETARARQLLANLVAALPNHQGDQQQQQEQQQQLLQTTQNQESMPEIDTDIPMDDITSNLLPNSTNSRTYNCNHVAPPGMMNEGHGRSASRSSSRSRRSRSRRRGRKRMSSHNSLAMSESSHCHSHLDAFAEGQSNLRCFIILLALSIHALFEGMAVGLQDNLNKLINLFAGVIIHECLVAAAIGVSMAQRNINRDIVLKLALAFCMMIPIGIGIGMGVGQWHSLTGEVISAVIQALAAGIFIYVVFMEIMPGELKGENDRILKTFFIFIGFTAIACLRAALHDE